jgi:hypothetical protein
MIGNNHILIKCNKPNKQCEAMTMMELLQQLTQSLGINEDQARGGAGLLFKMAQDKLEGGDFGKVAAALPGVDSLIKSAPGGGGLGAAIGSLASAFEGGDKLAGLAGLARGFSKLNLDSGMIARFIPIILSFAQSKGGDEVKNLLAGVLK